MNANTPDDSTHPANMSDADQKAALALLDNEDADAGEVGADEPAAAPTGEEATNTEAAATDTTTDEPPAAEDPPAPAGEAAGTTDAAGAGESIDPKAFRGVLKELVTTREKLKALEAQTAALTTLPAERDFKSEREALKEQWDQGDLDTDAYNDKRDNLVLEEAEYRAALRFHQMQSQAAQEAASQSWTEKVNGWQAANADFLANPIRRRAVDELMATLDADPQNRLTDDELLAKVQEQAFEAFNWGGTPAPAADVTADPRAVAAARAAAAASGAPPSITGGVGSGAIAAKVNLESAASDPTKFAGAKQAIRDVLGEEA